MCSRGQPSGDRRRLIPAGQMAGRLNQQHVFPLGRGEGAFGGEADGLKAEAVVGIKEAAGAGTPPARLLRAGLLSTWGGVKGYWKLWMTLWKSVGVFFFITHAAVKEALEHLIENRLFK